jgi:curli biogenesis system outer membrane secretion channel CsgG
MKPEGLRFRYRKLMNVLGIISLVVLGACSNLPSWPTSSSQPDSDVRTTSGPKKRIAVMQFGVKAPDTYGYQQIDLTAAEMLTTALFKTGKFIVVERSTLDKVLKEQGLGLAGFIDTSTAAEVGKIVGVQALVTGAISQIGIADKKLGIGGYGGQLVTTNVSLDVRLIDTTTSAILMADVGRGSHSAPSMQVSGTGSSQEKTDRSESVGKALREATDDVARRIIAQMQRVAWTGLIVSMTGKDVYINAGQDLGIKTGDALMVFRPGAVLRDPTTGEVLGKEETQIGQLFVTQVRERFAIAEVRSGSGFGKNDMVRLVRQ